jgi:hypothetical protein
MRRFAVVPLLGLLCLLHAASWCQVSEADAPKVMGEIGRKHRLWDPSRNSPGVSISLKEVERSSTQIKYELQAFGFPPNSKFTIVQWPTNRIEPQTITNGVPLNAAGIAICMDTSGICGGSKPNDPIAFAVTPLKSEPVRIALFSEGEPQLKAFLSVQPMPNRTANGNCTLESVMLLPNSILVALQGSGFKPNADVTLLSESAGEHHDGTQKSDSEGKIFAVLAPGVKGKEKGTTRVSLISAECNLSLSFPWGEGSAESK